MAAPAKMTFTSRNGTPAFQNMNDIEAAAFSTVRTDFEACPSSPSDEKRVCKPASLSPVRAISGAFVLLLLGVVGVVCYCYFPGSTNTPSIPSFLTSGGFLPKAASQTLSKPGSTAPAPLQRVWLTLSSSPRSVAATVFAVAVTIALIVTVVMLVKALNAPSVEKEIDVYSNSPGSSDPSDHAWYITPIVIPALLVGGVIICFVVMAFVGWYTGSFESSPRDEDIAILWGDNVGAMQVRSRELFEVIRKMVPANDADWAASNVLPHGASNNLCVAPLAKYRAPRLLLASTHYVPIDGRKTSLEYFEDMVSQYETLPEELKDGGGFVLVPKLLNSDEVLPADAPVPIGSHLVAVPIGSFAGGNPEKVRKMMVRLMEYNGRLANKFPRQSSVSSSCLPMIL